MLVGYDGSAEADLALEWAAQTALLEHRPVQVAIVDDWSIAMPGIPVWSESHWIELEERATQVLTQAGVDDQTVSRKRGPLVATMIDMARDSALLVLGSRGHSRAGELFMGSVSQHLARHAPCPVAVVRAAEGSTNRIVVGLDGSPASEEALGFACRRAERTGEKVTAVRAAKVGTVLLDGRGRMPDSLNEFLDEQEKQLESSVAEAAAAYPEVAIEPEFIALSAADALVEASRHASLVVVGSRGLNAFTGMLLGSVSHEVLHRAHCPVVVVR